MASGYSSNVSIAGNSNMLYRAYVNSYVSSQTDTTAIIYYEFSVQMYWAYLYGVKANVYVNGSWQKEISGYLSSNPGANWKTVCSGSGYATISKGSAAKSIPVKVNAWGETVSGIGSAGGETSATVWVTVPAIDYENPHDPTDVAAIRESDSKNTVSWGHSCTSYYDLYPVEGFIIERKTDGGSWSQVAKVASWDARSYSDTTTSENHFYEYRVTAYCGDRKSSAVAAGQVLYNTPCAPKGITASRLAETTVSLEIENAAVTAQTLEVQRSTDAEAWETVATISGSPVTSATDEPGGGTFYYRARNARDADDGGVLRSAWSAASNAVVTICAPNAPTLVAPASGVVVSKSQETVVFEHRHNPIDGSGQTAAQYRISTDGGATYAYHDIEGESEKLSLENAFAVNSKVTYAVRTKGAHDDYGPWSDNRVFYVYQAPSVAFAEPADGFIVENTPIHVALQHDDPSGTLASVTLIVKDGATAVYTRNMGTATECDILASEWLPDNGKAYTLSASVRSTSTLTASAVRDISVDFVLPQPAGISIQNDPETGHASLVVYVDSSIEDLEAPSSVSIWRETEDGRVLLGEGLQAGSAVLDRYAPLNADYRYIITSFADSGAANSQSFDNRLDTLCAFLYFADGGIARGKWNPEDSWKLKQDVDYVHYIGRRYPVAYMRDNMDETHDVSVTLMDRDEAREFRRMMATHEPVVAKLWEGLVFHAVPQVQGKPHSTVRSYWGEVAVSLTRIDGDAL